MRAHRLFFIPRKRRIGFTADAAIHGIRRRRRLRGGRKSLLPDPAMPGSSVVLWVIRGFGTAIMHGGTTAIFAIISKGMTQRLQRPTSSFSSFPTDCSSPSRSTLSFNRFVVSPLVSTVFVLFSSFLPSLFTFFFHRSERKRSELAR